MSKQKVIKPELLGGFRDILPEEAIVLNSMITKIKGVYESFGFVPLDTPNMERLAVLTGDASFDKTIFKTRVVRGEEDKDVDASDLGEDSALRFDLTVPLARVVSAYPDIPKPFKRYQLGKVFRGEKPQAGRYREFYQFDFDIIGSSLPSADLEVILIMSEVMKALEIKDFVIKFNSRKILNGLAEMLDRVDNLSEFFRVIDKIDKIGIDGVLKELQRKPDNEFDDTALSFNKEEVAKVDEFLNINGSAFEIIAKLKDFFGDLSDIGLSGVTEIEYICERLVKLKVPADNWSFDLSIARGLGYYNGPVFETFLTKMPKLGSIFSGGRFDGLTDRFIPNSNISGVGASVGIDRLLVGMKKLGLIEDGVGVTDVLVSVFSEDLRDESIFLASKLRKQGINAEVYLGDDSSLRGQISYALKKNASFFVIIGPEEKDSNKIQLKNLKERKQEAVSFEECVKIVTGK